MKRIFTLICLLLLYNANSQVILNEVYPIPGSNRHEFFELYNNTTGTTPVSMDDYSLVTYFEEPGNKKGFYVLDLPNISVPSQSYFVGAAATPFNYQGFINTNTAQFSWNNTAFLSANNGYLKKWVAATNIPAAVDGNEFYDQEAVPADFNDFFNKVGGGNASYTVFLYKNGVMFNCLLGGVGGAIQIPTFIVAMPSLHVDMAGAGTDFNIEFSTYANAPFEYVGQEVGTDNGFIRKRDGYCGSWTKSSSNVNHTPGTTNGGSMDEPATILVAAVISPGNATTGAILNYEVVSAPNSVFPVTLDVYVDDGTTPGRLDASDPFVTSSIAMSANDGAFHTTIPYGSNAIIVCKTNAGCIDRIIIVTNTGILPVKILSFQGNLQQNNAELTWSLAYNEQVKTVEIQTADGSSFKTIKTIFGSGKAGSENYSAGVTMFGDSQFRLLITDIFQKQMYSPVIFLAARPIESELAIVSGSEEKSVRIRYNSPAQVNATLTIYNTSGMKMMNRQVVLSKGLQEVSLPIEERLGAGMYILDIQVQQKRQTVKFLRR